MKKVDQALALNSTLESIQGYQGMGDDAMKLNSRAMPNTRMNDYVTNMYAGPGSHKGKVKMKGKEEHVKQEDEVGNSYGL